MKAFALSTCHF